MFLYRAVLEREFGWLDDVVRAKKPTRLPVVFTVDEASAVLGELYDTRWLMGIELYGGGLRAEQKFRRVKGHRQLPQLVAALDSAQLDAKPKAG